MVNAKALSLAIMLTAILSACSKDKITYKQATEIFHVGMSPAEVEKAYGKPEFEDELGGFVLWNYPPTEPVDTAAKGVKKSRGFQIEFRDNKTTKIAPTWSIEK